MAPWPSIRKLLQVAISDVSPCVFGRRRSRRLMLCAPDDRETYPGTLGLPKQSKRNSRGIRPATAPPMTGGCRMTRFYEFFAGAGMARYGLGDSWTCLFANDFDFKKGANYQLNHGVGAFHGDDIRKVRLEQLPEVAELVWGSFPCQDLSLAGGGAGLEGRTFRHVLPVLGHYPRAETRRPRPEDHRSGECVRDADFSWWTGLRARSAKPSRKRATGMARSSSTPNCSCRNRALGFS